MQLQGHGLASTTFPDAVSPASSASAVLAGSNVGSLEDVAARQLFYSIVALYLRHLYAVYPLVHRPTLANDLLAGRDLRDADFLAFILSLTAATLALLPARCYPASLSEQQGVNLQVACHAASKRSQSRTYSPARLIHVVTLLLDNVSGGSAAFLVVVIADSTLRRSTSAAQVLQVQPVLRLARPRG